MGKVLVFTEFTNAQGTAQLKKGALELLTAGRESGHDLLAVALGQGSAGLATQLGEYGVKTAWVCEDSKVNSYNPQIYTHLLSDLIKAQNPDVVLASSSTLATDVFPRVAARLGASVVNDCTELKFSGTRIEVRKPLYAGKCTAAVDFQSTPQIALIRSNQLPVKSAGAGAAAIEQLSVPALDLKVLVQDVVKGASERLDLTEANIIVSGGRGLKDAESFKILDELATVLGASLGASRAIVDAGWVPHSMQVGQTGKTVAPSLYIAVGISGAIQHLAGMSAAKVVVAINKDANAPIFQKATYGLVGDAFEIVPKLTAEFKKILHG